MGFALVPFSFAMEEIHMGWHHMVSKQWMTERAKYLNASSIKEILPFTESGRKRSPAQREAAMLKAWARNKIDYVPYDDCESTGAAARGHILEDPAIKHFSKACNVPMFHWDDVVVHNGIVGWSPDGLNVDQKYHPGYSIPYHEIQATQMCEVKSYSVEKHIAKLCELKSQHEERWQVATAFYVMPQLEKGYLIFFNPDVVDTLRLGVFGYRREDLEIEIDMIADAVDDFKLCCPVICTDYNPPIYCNNSDMYKMVAEKESNRMNPI